jgi:hypothetical protein
MQGGEQLVNGTFLVVVTQQCPSTQAPGVEMELLHLEFVLNQ